MIKAFHSELGSISYSLQNSLTFNFPYPCESYSICSPYEITFYPGRYHLEIWGASGGNLTKFNEFAQGGKGGYSTGVFTVKQNSEVLYLYLGGQKDQSNPLIVRAIDSRLLSGTPKHGQLYSRARLGVPPPVPGDTPK